MIRANKGQVISPTQLVDTHYSIRAMNHNIVLKYISFKRLLTFSSVLDWSRINNNIQYYTGCTKKHLSNI